MAHFDRKMYPTSMGVSTSKNVRDCRAAEVHEGWSVGTYCHSRKKYFKLHPVATQEKTSTYYDDGVPS